MKRFAYYSVAALALAFVCQTSAQAQTPNPNAAFTQTAYFNDCPVSVPTVTNSYPALVRISEVDAFGCAGGLNKDLWKFSEDGGATKAAFNNNSNYSFCADVTLSGQDTADLEGGIEISPWWSDGDGQFYINGNSGEIAAFGGRLPFYTFTVAYGAHYVLGSTIHMACTYISGPIDPTISSVPATVKYDIVIGGTPYTSGPLNFDQGNTSENPPHGLWGELNPASVGGYLQVGHTGAPTNGSESWANICYSNLQTTPAKQTSWGALKTLYR